MTASTQLSATISCSSHLFIIIATASLYPETILLVGHVLLKINKCWPVCVVSVKFKVNDVNRMSRFIDDAGMRPTVFHHKLICKLTPSVYKFFEGNSVFIGMFVRLSSKRHYEANFTFKCVQKCQQ